MSVIANSGSAQDIQAAVDYAILNSIKLVEIPSGDWEWGQYDKVLVENSVDLTIKGQGIGITNLYRGSYIPYPTRTLLFDIVGGVRPRLTSMTIDGYLRNFIDERAHLEDYPDVHVEGGVVTVGVQVRDGCTDFRLDHVEIKDFTSACISSQNYGGIPNHRGLIDHCIIDHPYKIGTDFITKSTTWGYGILLVANYTVGGFKNLVEYYLGKYDGLNDVLYVEDCSIDNTRHAIASNQNAWYVLRHCTIGQAIPYQFGQVDVHEGGVNTSGGRGFESYLNKFVGRPHPANNQYYGVGHWIRGGSGVVWGNKYLNYATIASLEYYGAYGFLEWQKSQDWWIWNETGNANIINNNPSEIVEGVDYFVGTPKPGYGTYPYPHPLTDIPPKPSIPLWLLAIPAGLILLKDKKKG